MTDKFSAFTDLDPTAMADDFEDGITDPEDQERMQRVEEREKALLVKLQEKQAEELEEKNKRRENALLNLEEMMQERQNEIDSMRQSAKEQQLENQNHGDTGNWGIVKNNIALKNGEYSGQKDISRMKESIVNKAGDEATS